MTDYFRSPRRPPAWPATSPFDADESWDEPWEDDLWDDDPVPPELGLSAVQQASLADALDAALRERGCDNTLRAVQAWAAAAGLSWEGFRSRLEGRGGYCDCEVVFNALEPG